MPCLSTCRLVAANAIPESIHDIVTFLECVQGVAQHSEGSNRYTSGAEKDAHTAATKSVKWK